MSISLLVLICIVAMGNLGLLAKQLNIENIFSIWNISVNLQEQIGQNIRLIC